MADDRYLSLVEDVLQRREGDDEAAGDVHDADAVGADKTHTVPARRGQQRFFPRLPFWPCFAEAAANHDGLAAAPLPTSVDQRYCDSRRHDD